MKRYITYSTDRHLDNCYNIRCRNMYKCAEMCDHIIDCSGGFDEPDCPHYICPGMLRCSSTSFLFTGHRGMSWNFTMSVL